MADPRIPSPAVIRPIMGFSRLSAAAYGRLRKAVDEDDEFRRRVAEAADEATVGRAGYLWLTRPDGWEDDPVFAEAPGSTTTTRRGREHGTIDAKLIRAREKAAKADEARRRAQDQRAAATVELERVAAELSELQSRVADLEEERNAAIRSQKALESKLADVRHDLKVARAATRQAEEELLAARSTATPVDATGSGDALDGDGGSQPAPGGGQEQRVAPASAASVSSSAPTAEPVGPAATVDAAAASAAVQAASAAAAELARSLSAAARALEPPSTSPAGPAETGAAPSGRPTADRPPADRSPSERRRRDGDRRRTRRKRRAPSLPPGVFDDSPEARRHLVSDPEVHVVVDGYNLAREAWTGLAPEEERRRTVALLEEITARSGAPITVVFDGDDSAVAPAASRVVRVRFSATGVTADDDIAEMLPHIPHDQPVLVVSSDREVATDARSQGAAVLSSAEFLAAIGR